MSKLERWTVAPGGLTQHPLGECVLTVDHLAEVQRLRELVADAEHLCKWLLQSDISDDDRERVTRENGINFAAALQAEPQMWLMVAAIARNLAAMGFVAKETK